jgi:hypothetical protein
MTYYLIGDPAVGFFSTATEHIRVGTVQNQFLVSYPKSTSLKDDERRGLGYNSMMLHPRNRYRSDHHRAAEQTEL